MTSTKKLTKGKGTSPICVHSTVVFKRLFSFFQNYVKEVVGSIIENLKFKFYVILLLNNPFIIFWLTKFQPAVNL